MSRPTTLRTALAGAVLILSLALGFIALGGRIALPNWAADRVRARAMKSGVEISWTDATLSICGLTLHEVRLAGRVTGRVERVRVGIDWRSALTGHPRVSWAVFREGTLTLPSHDAAVSEKRGPTPPRTTRVHLLDIEVRGAPLPVYLGHATVTRSADVAARGVGRVAGVPLRFSVVRSDGAFAGQVAAGVSVQIEQGSWTARFQRAGFAWHPTERHGWIEGPVRLSNGPNTIDLDRIERHAGGVLEVSGPQLEVATALDPTGAPTSLRVALRGFSISSISSRFEGTLDGEVFIAADPHTQAQPALARRWIGSGRLALTDGRALFPKVSEAELGQIGLAAAFDFESAPSEHAARIRLRAGQAQGDLQFTVTDTSADVGVTLPPTSCAALVHALPDGLLGAFRNARISGEVGGEARISVPLADPYRLKFDVEPSGGCRVDGLDVERAQQPRGETSDDRLGPDVAWLRSAFTRRVPEATRPVFVGPGSASYVAWRSLPSHVRAAMWVSEDVGFFRHGALSVGLIRRALKFNLRARRFVYGGSTITQQLVKNLFLTRKKTLARKLQEALVALRVHQVVSRERILELYVNCIEFAPNVYGINAAAWHYFQKPPSRLTPMEAVFLARAKPSPRYAQQMKARGRTPDTDAWRKYNRQIFEHLVRTGTVSRRSADDAEPYGLTWDPTGRATPM